MPVFLPGESHGQRSLEGYSPQGCKESDTTEATQHACTLGFRTADKRLQVCSGTGTGWTQAVHASGHSPPSGWPASPSCSQQSESRNAGTCSSSLLLGTGDSGTIPTCQALAGEQNPQQDGSLSQEQQGLCEAQKAPGALAAGMGCRQETGREWTMALGYG